MRESFVCIFHLSLFFYLNLAANLKILQIKYICGLVTIRFETVLNNT